MLVVLNIIFFIFFYEKGFVVSKKKRIFAARSGRIIR